MVRAAHADPADAGVARELDRGLGGARHHQMAHAVVAVDQRGRGRGLLDPDVGLRIDAAAAQPLDVLRQPEHAVGVGAGEVGLEHQLGDLGGVGGRQPDRLERIRDQRGDGRGRHPRRRIDLIHGAVPAYSCS